MRKIFFPFFLFLFLFSCKSEVSDLIEDGFLPEIDMDVSIISPVRDRDYSFHNGGESGVFENPAIPKKLKAKIDIQNMKDTSTDFMVRWVSSLDGKLYEGKPDENLESEIDTKLSTGIHKVYFEVYSGKFLLEKDSIIITNEIGLKASNETGRSMRLLWTKYQGSDFLSYLLYTDTNEPVVEIFDIDKLSYEHLEQKSLIDTCGYQVVVKTKNDLGVVHGSNIVSERSGIFLELDCYISKIIKDPGRSKIYAIASPYNDYHPGRYGLLILDPVKLNVEAHILKDQKFSDLDISLDGKTLYLTRKWINTITKVDLNTLSVSELKTNVVGNWGFHKIEAGHDNILYCHRTPPTSGGSPLYMIDAESGDQLSWFEKTYVRHGDLEYNEKNRSLYKDETNTTSGRIHGLKYEYGKMNELGCYPGYDVIWGIDGPSPYMFLSDDSEFVFWEKFQLNKDLDLIRKFENKMIACSPSNTYLSDMKRVYNYIDLAVKFEYPPFPPNDEVRTILFIDNNTIITSKAYQSSIINYPPVSYFFKMKVK